MNSYCTFHLAELYLGIEVTRVQEVIRGHHATRVPLVHHVVSGLLNLRGEIVTQLDVRRRLDLEPRQSDRPSMNVVVHTPDGPISLLVDEIDEVLDVDEDDFELPPPNLRGIRRDLVTGVYKLDDRILLVLDLERLLDIHTSPEPREVPAP